MHRVEGPWLPDLELDQHPEFKGIKMIKKTIIGFIAVAMLFGAGLSTAVMAGEDKVHKVVLHVTSDNLRTMNIALNVAKNVTKHYGIGNVDIEIVANGPGLALFHKSSPLQKRLQYLASLGNVKFAVCNNTMNKKKYTKADLLPDAFIQNAIVPAGVVRVMELQEEGYSYIRP